jgi:hypothetical protein
MNSSGCRHSASKTRVNALMAPSGLRGTERPARGHGAMRFAYCALRCVNIWRRGRRGRRSQALPTPGRFSKAQWYR